MIADHVEPWDSHEGHDAVVGLEERKIIKEDVAEGHPELGIRVHQLLDGIPCHEPQLLFIAGLGISKEVRLELERFFLPDQGEVDRGGQGAGGLHTGKLALW